MTTRRADVRTNGSTSIDARDYVSLYGPTTGDLVRLAVQRAEPVGGFTGWRSAMPVTIWSVVKP